MRAADCALDRPTASRSPASLATITAVDATGKALWALVLNDETPAGNMRLDRFDDAGKLINSPISAIRATGELDLNTPAFVSRDPIYDMEIVNKRYADSQPGVVRPAWATGRSRAAMASRTGPTGPQGPQGIQGPPGTGERAAGDGPPGPQGPIGRRRAPTGAWEGPPGPQGPQGRPRGAQGPPGTDGGEASSGPPVAISETPPPAAVSGDLWWDSSRRRRRIVRSLRGRQFGTMGGGELGRVSA